MKFKRHFTTPIHPLSEEINDNSFYVKREDLFPFSFGGNKARKALLFIEDFKDKEADSIVTYGASSSNHCRIIANVAAAMQIPCYIVAPSESNYPTSNRRMVELFGAEIIETPVSQVSSKIEEQLRMLENKGYSPYFIPGGGHGNIGTQAYINVYEEIVRFETSNQIFFDYIFHSSGTGTTQAGLICGKHINGDDRKIIGISNARKNPYGCKVVKESLYDYVSEFNLQPINSNDISFVDDYVLNGYGSYNKEILQTIKDILISDGIPMDPTYTGKAYWGMKEYIRENDINNKNILFIHTGGTPLFFDNMEEL